MYINKFVKYFLLYLIVSIQIIQIHSQINVNTYGFDIVSNISINVKDQQGIVHTQNINTLQVYFNSTVGGQVIQQVLNNGNSSLIFEVLIEPIRYILKIKDTPSAIPQLSTYYDQDIGSSTLTQDGVTPPASLINNTFPQNQFQIMSANEYDSNYMNNKQFSLMSNNINKARISTLFKSKENEGINNQDSHMRSLKQASLVKQLPDELPILLSSTVNNDETLNPQTTTSDVTGINPAVAQTIIINTLTRIDIALAATLGRSHSPSWQSIWLAGDQSIGGYACTNSPTSFSFGFDTCNSYVKTIADDENKMVCFANMYAKWLELEIAHGQDCTTWSSNILPDQSWCYQGGGNLGDGYLKWSSKAVDFINVNRQARVTLSLSSPVCSQLVTNYPTKPNQVLNADSNSINQGDPTKGFLCSISGEAHTISSTVYSNQDGSFTPSQNSDSSIGSFNIFNTTIYQKNNLKSYTYYDSPDCPCMPVSTGDMNFYYTCPDNPWTVDFPDQTSPYKVGILQKCSPFDPESPTSGGYCVPLLEDVNMYDYSTGTCETVRGSYPKDCLKTFGECVALITGLVLVGLALGPLDVLIGGIGFPLCIAAGLDHCPDITICAKSFAAHSQMQIDQTIVVEGAQNTGTFAFGLVVGKALGGAEANNSLLAATVGLSAIQLKANNLSAAITLQEQSINKSQSDITNAIALSAKVNQDIAAQQTYQYNLINGQLNKTISMFQQIESIDPIFFNQTAIALSSQNQTEFKNINQLILINHNAKISEDSMHESVAIMQQEVEQLPIFQAFGILLQQLLTNATQAGLIPLVSDYNSENKTWGQIPLGQLPDSLQNLAIGNYWSYALEWIIGSTGSPSNPDLTNNIVRIHQENWTMTCNTFALFSYSNVTVLIDQLRGMVSPGVCSVSVVHTSCLSSITLGTLISSILTSNGNPSQYALFQQMNANLDVGHHCQGGSYLLHNQTTFTYSYQWDAYITTSCQLSNLITTLPNSILWPGFSFFRAGESGGSWMAGYNNQYCGTDEFSRQLADVQFTNTNINSFMSTLFGLFDISFSIGLGSTLFLTTKQAYVTGRLPRVGVSQESFKVQVLTNQTAAQNSANTSDPNTIYSTFRNAQLSGFSNGVSFDFMAIGPKSVPVHIVEFDDQVQVNVTMLLSATINSSSYLVENQILNTQLFSNNQFVTLSTIIDETKITNSIATSQTWIGYFSCWLYTTGCPKPITTLQENSTDRSIIYYNYIYDIEEIDINIYARSWSQKKGLLGYFSDNLGVKLVEQMINDTFIDQLVSDPWRNSSNINTTALPPWGKSVLAYLNYSGISINTTIPAQTDIIQYIFEELYNNRITVTSSNEDLIQFLADYLPFFASLSLNSYLVTVVCNTVIPAPPFNNWKMWACTCLKPLAERAQRCRMLDLFYAAVPVSWLGPGYNPDFWDHFYLQPRNQMIQISWNIQDFVATRVIATRQACPDPSSIYVSEETAGGLPYLAFNRPQYSSNVTLEISMQIASVNYYNQSVFSSASLEQDCATYAALQQNSTFDSSLNVWNIVNMYNYPQVPLNESNNANTAPITVYLPSAPCQPLSINIIRLIDRTNNQTCFSWATSAVSKSIIPDDSVLSIVSNQLQSITVINSLSYANILNQVSLNLGTILESFMGSVKSTDVSKFASTAAIIDQFIQQGLTINPTTTNTSTSTFELNGTIPLGKISVPANSTFTDNTTVYNVNPPSNQSIGDSLFYNGINFTAQYLAAWNGNSSQLSDLSGQISDLLNANAATNQGAFASVVAIALFVQSVSQSNVLFTNKWDKFIADYNARAVKYNQTAAIVAAMQQPFFKTLTQSQGWACLNDWAKLQSQYPNFTQGVVKAITDTYNLIPLIDEDKVVSGNPGSWFNGISDDGAKTAVWFIFWIGLFVIICYLLAWWGSTDKVQDGRSGCFCLVNFSNVLLCMHIRNDDEEEELEEENPQPKKRKTLGKIIDRVLLEEEAAEEAEDKQPNKTNSTITKIINHNKAKQKNIDIPKQTPSKNTNLINDNKSSSVKKTNKPPLPIGPKPKLNKTISQPPTHEIEHKAASCDPHETTIFIENQYLPTVSEQLTEARLKEKYGLFHNLQWQSSSESE